MDFDSKDVTLLLALQRNSRLSFAELGRMVKLSAPAAAERVRRMEDQKWITGYHAAVDPARLGRSLQVFVRVQVAPQHYSKFKARAAAMDDVLECHHLTGDSSFLLRAAVQSVGKLEDLIQKLSTFGTTATSVVLSTVVERKSLLPVRG